jgi:hypothetical protein
MVVEGIQAVPTLLNHISPWHSALGGLSHQLSVDWLVLAQEVRDPDVIGQMVSAWNHFVKTGQIWALLIGVIVGYVFRSFTSF